MSGKKVIWDSHEDYFKQFQMSTDYRTYLPKIVRNLVSNFMLKCLKYIDKNAAGIIASTEVIQRTYKNQNTTIVGNEARREDFQNLSPNFESRKVLFVGSMSEAHCFSAVVRAVSNIDGLELIIAGNADQSLLLKSQAILGDRLSFVGWASRNQLLKLISSSTVGMVTYQSSPTYNDSQPTKLFEFLMSGLPVVASPITPNLLTLKESKGGILSGGFDWQDFEISLREMMSSKEAWHNFSKNGKKWAVKNANWENSEKNLLLIYKSVLGS